MKAQAPHLSEQLKDIQGMLRSGYGWLQTSRFWLLSIKDGQEEAARTWLASKSELVVDAGSIGKGKRVESAAAIAFSFAGLKKLGRRETEAHPFPTPFRSGMGSDLRAKLLRDDHRDWCWSDVDGADCGPVHVLIAEWTPKGAGPLITGIDEKVFCVIRIENDPCAFFDIGGEEKLREAFGFRDGLAQPVIRGLKQDDDVGKAKEEIGPLYDDRVVSPGEFILGYRNEYNELTYCPNVEGWTQSRRDKDAGRFGLNGSYLAVRQIKQNVKAFNAFRDAYGQDVCNKLMGRQDNGLPLGWKYDPNNPISDSQADAFRFRVEDANGFVCPKGAHVRRVNPRDSLGTDVESSITSTKLHRLLRRGRPYLKESEADTHNGIFFIACNADLERQFEFIHQRWVRNPGFGGLHADDPLVGSGGSKEVPKPFSIPGLASGDEVYSLEAFTTTLGGGYFFLPGIAALKFIVEPPVDARETLAEPAKVAAL